MNIMDRFNQLEAKQKLMLGAVIVLFIYLIYLAMDTFSGSTGGSTSTAPIKPSRKAQASASTTTATEAPSSDDAATAPEGAIADLDENQTLMNTSTEDNKNMTTSTAANNVDNAYQAAQRNQISTIRTVEEPAPTPEQLALLAESEEMQREYLRLTSQYQMAQLKAKLEQANLAIAASQLKSAETEAMKEELAAKQRAALMAQNAPPAATPSDNTEQQQAQNQGGGNKPQAIYVGKQRGNWMAMLSLPGTPGFVEVKVGTQLPDGSVVSHITHQGVAVTGGPNGTAFFHVPKSVD